MEQTIKLVYSGEFKLSPGEISQALMKQIPYLEDMIVSEV